MSVRVQPVRSVFAFVLEMRRERMMKERELWACILMFEISVSWEMEFFLIRDFGVYRGYVDRQVSL